MAKLKNSLESTLSGKIGNVVFVQMDGNTYARSVPRRKKGSWSPKQKLHRQRFRLVNDFCHKFLDESMLKIWNQAGPNRRGYHLFVKTNMPAFALDGSLIDIQMLQVTEGRLHLPQMLKLQKVEDVGTLATVSWKNDPNLEGPRLDDQLMAISSDGKNFSKIMATGIKRSILKASFELPALRLPLTHVFLFFASADRIDYSASICIEL